MQVADLSKICILFHIQSFGIMSILRKNIESSIWA
jgi:hypothetical protein